jgi:hypothetical protein
MQFVQRGNLLIATRITGPSHNFLGVELAPPGVIGSVPRAEAVDSPSGCEGTVAAESILDWVTEGLAQVNSELGASYRLSRLQFVSTDTPHPHAYRMLIVAIIKRVHNGCAFAGSDT